MSEKKPENQPATFLSTPMLSQGTPDGEYTRRSEWHEYMRGFAERRDQDRYLTKLARAMRGEDPFQYRITRQPKQTTEVLNEVEQLRAELERERALRIEAETLLKMERLDPASRTGIYRTLWAALVGGYGFRPENEEGLASIPGDLIKDAAEVGGAPDVKTARKHVRGAFDQYKEDQKKR